MGPVNATKVSGATGANVFVQSIDLGGGRTIDPHTNKGKLTENKENRVMKQAGSWSFGSCQRLTRDTASWWDFKSNVENWVRTAGVWGILTQEGKAPFDEYGDLE